MSFFIGIDPGKSGGAAILDQDGKLINFINFKEDTPHEIYEKLRWVDDPTHTNNVQIVIESVGAFPGQGVHSMFVFGEQYGMIQGILVALGFKSIKVPPQKWKGAMGLITKGKKTDRKERKFRSRAMAQQLFPGEKITDQNAEALLLAEYCRRINK